MADTEAPAGTTRLFPPYLLWFVLIPAIPFFFSAISLSFFANPDDITLRLAGHDSFIKKLLDTDISYIAPALRTLTHLSNLLTYLSVTAVHGVVCLIVIGFLLYQIHKLSSDMIKRTYIFMAITALIFFALAYAVHLYSNQLILTQLGYKSICILLSKAELQTTLIWADPDGGQTGEACFLSRNTRLVWLAYTPIALGILAIIVASAFTTVLASQSISSADKEWRPQFLSRIKLLQKSFYLLSLVLVTSTITILYFTSLPQDLLTTSEFKQVLEKLFGGLTAFWGGLFTATLFATFIPAISLFVWQARHHQQRLKASPDLSQWLNESVFISFRKQAMNVFVIIAPMLVGPFSELLRNLSGIAG